jgi:hypothetical protein
VGLLKGTGERVHHFDLDRHLEFSNIERSRTAHCMRGFFGLASQRMLGI